MLGESTLFIDGKSVPTSDTFDVINPATGEVFHRCALGTAVDIDKAITAARRAFPAWSATSDEERKSICVSLAGILKQNMPELMQILTTESGKPMDGLNGVGSGMEVGGAMTWAQVNGGLELPVEILRETDETRIELHRKPLGVIGSITPWNWPLLIAIWHLIPALRAGNTVVIKPSEYTPVATTRFVELASAVLPAGVLNVVTGKGEAGAALSQHPGVNKIIFTGSTATGRRIMEASAATLKRLTLELGGNDAGIVLDDVDVKKVAPQLFGACFHNNGQTCAALKRLYVHESIHDELVSAMASLANRTVVGNGLEEGTELGPLQNKAQFDIVQGLADNARANGATFAAGGMPIEGGGYFFQPTVVTGLTDGARLVDEEQFGPIVPVIKYSDIDEVIERANMNPNGLGGSVWSSDIDRAVEVALRLQCGTVWVNEHGAVQPDAPFGGIKQSGFGVQFGQYGLEEFSYIQTLQVTK